MGKKTGITWCNSSWNGWFGCEKVSAGCRFCYAEREAQKYGYEIWGPSSSRKVLSDKNWNNPIRWNREAERNGIRWKVFTASMGDVFEDHKDLIEPRKRMWELIRNTPNLDWQLLTKRPENIRSMLPDGFEKEPWQNVWLGTSVESNEYRDRIEILRSVPAYVRWLSCEPLIGSVTDIFPTDPSDNMKRMKAGIDWIVVGGESGSSPETARPMNTENARSILRECRAAGAAFFFKQFGNWVDSETAMTYLGVDLNECEYPTMTLDGVSYVHMGKKLTGDKLDGIEYKEFPTVC